MANELNFLSQIKACHFRHGQVCDDSRESMRFMFKNSQGFERPNDHGRRITAILKGMFSQLTDAWFIVHKENRFTVSFGNIRGKQLRSNDFFNGWEINLE